MTRRRAFAREHVRAQAFGRKERVGEVGRVVIDAVLLFDEPARLDPSHNHIAIRLRQGRVRLDVVQSLAVGEEPSTLRSARMLAGERNLLRVDHLHIVRRGIRWAPCSLEGG